MRFLRTTRVARLGYRPPSGRNVVRAAARPFAPVLLQVLGASSGVPASNDLSAKWGPVKDQGPTGSCTACSKTKSARLTLLRSADQLPGGVQDYSEDDLYKVTRALERAAGLAPNATTLDPLQDVGADPIDVNTAIAQYGVVGMGQNPSGDGRYSDVDLSTINDEPQLDVQERGAQLLLPGAYQLDFTASDAAQQVQACNAQGLGQTHALFVDTAFMNWDPNTGPITKIDLNDPQGGGHQIGLVGYRTDPALGLVLKYGNSWGISYGVAGFVEIAWSCLIQGALDAIEIDNVSVVTGKAA